MTVLDARVGTIGARLTAHTDTSVTLSWLDEAGDPWTPTGDVSLWIGGTLDSDPTDLAGATEFADTGGGSDPNVTTHVLSAGAAGSSAFRATVGDRLVGIGQVNVDSSYGTPNPSQAWTVSLGSASATFQFGGPPGPKGDDGSGGGGAVDSVNGQTGPVVLDATDVGADPAGTAAGLVGALGTAAHADTGDFATSAQGNTADSAIQPGDLANVATSGDYTDLANTPTIPSTPQEVGADPAGTAAGLVGAITPTSIGAEVAGAAGAVAGDLTDHENETTGAHGGIVASTDPRLTDARTPTAHGHTVGDVSGLGTAAQADTDDFATSAQGNTADTALQPADLSGTGLATYDDQTGVIDVAASAVESIAEAEASDAVMALPEPVGSASIGVDDATPGLLRFSRRVLRLPPGDASNPSGEQSILNPAGQPVIPAGVLEMAGAYALLDISGVVANNSGDPRELTLRVKLTSDPEGTPATVTPFEFVLPDIGSLGSSALWPWQIRCVVAFVAFFAQPVTTGQGSCELAHPTTGVVETSLLRQPPLGQIVADPATTPYRVGLTAEMDSGASTEVGCSTAFLRFMEPA